LRAAGGSIDAPTKQVAKLRNKTGNIGLSPLNPVPLPSVTLTAVGIREAGKSSSASKRRRSLAATNLAQSKTALTAENLAKTQSTRFSETRLRRSILGRQGRAT
jgi:hypothetical protein